MKHLQLLVTFIKDVPSRFSLTCSGTQSGIACTSYWAIILNWLTQSLLEMKIIYNHIDNNKFVGQLELHFYRL